MTQVVAVLAAALVLGCTTWRATLVGSEPRAAEDGDGEYLLVTADLAIDLAITRSDVRSITGTIVGVWRVPLGPLARSPDDAAYLVDTNDAPNDVAAHFGWAPVATRVGLTITVARADVLYARRSEVTFPRAARVAIGVALGLGVLALLAIGFTGALMAAIPD